MKIGFVEPPWPGYGHRTQRWPHKNMHGDINPPPLFQMLAATIAQQAGIKVKVWDSPADRLGLDELLEKIFVFDPDLLVINTSTPSFDHDISFVNSISKHHIRGKILLVGAHVSIYWEDVLNSSPAVDFIAIGEYDYLPRDLCLSAFNVDGLIGLAYRNSDGQPLKKDGNLIENVNELPWPDYSLVNISHYNEFLFPPLKKPIATIMTSRGCPFQCDFCLYPQVLFGHKLRTRMIESVIEEIKNLIKTYHVRFIYFEDDTFTANWKRVREFCNALIEHDVHIPWGCLGRVSGATQENLALMRKAGCYLIKYGVETAEQNQLDSSKKGISLDEIKKAFRNTHISGIMSHATVMFGYPGDTLQTINNTHHLLRELAPDYVQFSICTPFPGTRLFNYCQKQNLLRFDKWEDFDGAWGGVIETDTLTRSQVKKAVIEGYKRYYFRFPYLLRRLNRSLRGPDIVSQWLQNIDLFKRFLRRYVFYTYRNDIQ